MYRSLALTALVPPGAVTVTSTAPTAPAGAVAVIEPIITWQLARILKRYARMPYSFIPALAQASVKAAIEEYEHAQ